MSHRGFYTSIDRRGNSILYRGYDEECKRVYETYKYRPTMYMESKTDDADWRSLEGVPLEPIKFNSMSECREFVKQYDEVDGVNIYGNDRHIPAFIQSKYPNEIEYSSNLIDVCNIDIEVDYDDTGFPEPAYANQSVLTIALKSSRRDHYILWGMKAYDPNVGSMTHIKTEYRRFDTEREMLQDFVDWWSNPENTPDVITGWNTQNFDTPYLVNRIIRIFDEQQVRRLSPWRMVEQKESSYMGRLQVSVKISGIQELDYLDLFKKFTLNTYGRQESYRLDNIAEVVLGENKLDYSDVGGLKELYEQDFQRYCDYNLKDVELIDRLEQKLGLINLVYTLAYFGGVNYTDTLGTVGIWDSIIFRHLANKKISVPQKKNHSKVAYAGGYVKEVKPGMYGWVMSFDLNSLYPALICQYNMSPETVVRQSFVSGMGVEKILAERDVRVPDENLAVAANGATFRRDKQGFLPNIIEELSGRRVKTKKEMILKKKEKEKVGKNETSKLFALDTAIDRLDTEQMCIKILLNSLYGAIGNQWFRFFDIAIAEGITLSGQLSIRWAAESVNRYVSKFLQEKTIKDRVIAIDTDSVYLNCDDIIDKFKPKDPVKFLDEFGEKAIEPTLDKAYSELATKTNSYKNTMVMKREAIANRAIWVAKKRYILNVLNNEGVQYTEPQIKMMGIEAIKSSTPKVCRDAMKEMFKVIINEDEVTMQSAIRHFRDFFNRQPANIIGMPRGVSSVTKFANSQTIYEKGTPMHCRASLLHNKRIKDMGLGNRVESIRNGDKIKYVFLNLPNPINENVIAFIDTLPKAFGLDQYIDYDMQFTKTFLEPIDLILKSIDWHIEPQSSLEEFFG